MTKLRDVIASDNARVFMNLDEFAEVHTLGATRVPCIIQDVVLNADLTVDTRGNPSQYQGLYGAACLINVRVEDLPRRPAPGVSLRVDGKVGEVVAVGEDLGILTITWLRNNL